MTLEKSLAFVNFMIEKTTRIIGIDPGFGRLGYGILEKENSSWKVLDYGCIETSTKKNFIDRLQEIHVELQKIIKKYKPDCAGVEDLFFAKNIKTAMSVGQARGVILLTLIMNNIEVHEFTPLQIKQAITGYGRADKNQIQKMVEMELKINSKIKLDDTADALAAALTCASCLNFNKKTAKL